MLWLSFPLFLLSRLAEGPRSSTSDASIEPDGDGDSDPGEFGRRPAAPAHRRPFAFRPRPQPLPGIHRPTASFVRLVDRPNQSSRVPPCPPKVQLKMRPIRRRRPRLPADLFRPRERWFDVGGRPLQPIHQPTRSPPGPAMGRPQATPLWPAAPPRLVFGPAGAEFGRTLASSADIACVLPDEGGCHKEDAFPP